MYPVSVHCHLWLLVITPPLSPAFLALFILCSSGRRIIVLLEIYFLCCVVNPNDLCFALLLLSSLDIWDHPFLVLSLLCSRVLFASLFLAISLLSSFVYFAHFSFPTWVAISPSRINLLEVWYALLAKCGFDATVKKCCRRISSSIASSLVL